MRISGAPSVIRKRAAASSDATDSVNLQKKHRTFSTPFRRTDVLQALSDNGSLGPRRDACGDDSLDYELATVISTRGKETPDVREFDKEVINIEDDNYAARSPKHKERERRNLETPSLPIKKQGLPGTGESFGTKKARLGVGFIKPGFKPPSLFELRSGFKPLDSSINVLLRERSCSSSTLKNPKNVGVHQKKDADPPSNYYYVMYCSRKLNAKHKGPWSDGILVSRGRSCILQDTEGKTVTKDNGHRCGDMSDGATFPLGKFEVEIMRKSTEEEFLSGKIFAGTDDVQVSNVTNTAIKRSFKRPIVSHRKDGAAVSSTTSHLTTVQSSSSLRLEPSCKQTTVAEKQVKDDDLLLNAKEVRRGAKPVVVDPYVASKLREHQQEGVRFMYECVMGLRSHKFTGCLLADAMGLGKTLQVIALIWTLLNQGPRGRPAVKRVLVICPSSLVENWGKEVRKWLGSERLNALIIHSGTSTKDVKRKISTFQMGKLSPVLITSYEFLRKYSDDLRSAKPELLVCDEAHRLKNCAGNKTIDALLALNCPMKVLLTGTPVQNDLMEFYAMLDFANKDLLGPLSAFKRLYADPIEKSRDRDASDEERNLGRKRSAELQLRTRPYILQRSSDVNLMYLPQKTELVVFCKLQPPQVSLYQKFLKSKTVQTLFHTSSQSAVILSAIGTLRKLCNHPKLVHSELTREIRQNSPERSQDPSARSEMIRESEWTLSGKLSCLYKILSAVHMSTTPDTPDKIVVVSNFTQTLDIIENLCGVQGWKWIRLDGSTEVSDRQTKVDRFNSDYSKERVFLLSSKAGGSGLNLIGANRLVLFDPDWNPATDAQAMARVWRDGQKKAVLIYRLLSAGSIEEKIYQRQIMKQEVAAAVGEQFDGQSRQSGRHFSREELRELFTLRSGTRCDTYDLLSQSTEGRAERWRDFSDELQDYALEEAIQTGIVTFIRKIQIDIRTSDCSDEYDAPPRSSEEVGELDIHLSDNRRSESCTLPQKSSPELTEPGRISHSSDGHSPTSRDLYRTDLEDSAEQNHEVDNCYLTSGRFEPISPRLEDHDDRRPSLARSESVSRRCTDLELDYIEGNNDHPDIFNMSPRMVKNVDPSDLRLSEKVAEHETYAVVESDGRQIEHCHLDGGCPSYDVKNSSLNTTRLVHTDESTTSKSMVETSGFRDPVCQSEGGCFCLLGDEGHKLLNYMLETFRSTGHDVDDLEALDMPFLSSLELEIELQKAEFTPQKLWEGFKLFVFGFLLGRKQEKIFYGCSTLGLILEKCNGDKFSTAESVFCKGLPLVLSALSRRHGRYAVELPTLLNLYEDKGQLAGTPVGRLLIELTRRCNSTDMWADV